MEVSNIESVWASSNKVGRPVKLAEEMRVCVNLGKARNLIEEVAAGESLSGSPHLDYYRMW